MSPLLITAAETSKTAWYVLGGVLAIYAVVLSGLGLSRPAFPGNERGARMVMAVTFVFVVLAIGAGILTG